MLGPFEYTMEAREIPFPSDQTTSTSFDNSPENLLLHFHLELGKPILEKRTATWQKLGTNFFSNQKEFLIFGFITCCFFRSI